MRKWPRDKQIFIILTVGVGSIPGLGVCGKETGAPSQPRGFTPGPPVSSHSKDPCAAHASN